MVDRADRVTRAVLGGLGATGPIGYARRIADALRGHDATDDPIAEMFYRFASARPDNDLEALAACIVGMRSASGEEAMSRIQTPILVVVGDQDPDHAASPPGSGTRVPPRGAREISSAPPR